MKSCDLCLRTKPVTRKMKARMQSFQASELTERLAMDILGPMPRTESRNAYVVVVIDYFIKWGEVFALQNHNQRQVFSDDMMTVEEYVRQPHGGQ